MNPALHCMGSNAQLPQNDQLPSPQLAPASLWTHYLSHLLPLPDPLVSLGIPVFGSESLFILTLGSPCLLG